MPTPRDIIADAVSDSDLWVDAEYDDDGDMYECRAHLKRDVQVVKGRSIQRENHIALDLENFGDGFTGVERHGRVEIDGDTWEITDRISDDGRIAKFEARLIE